MATDVVTPLMQHALDVGQLFIDNSALKNGVPVTPQRYKLGQLPDAPAAAANTPPNTSWPAWIKTAALTAGGLAAGGVGAGLVNWLTAKPLGPSNTVNVSAPGDGSLLQYLQDRGYHLPPEERK